ncbi:hypothetical protein ACKWTF_000738 [Chironomus riparius]
MPKANKRKHDPEKNVNNKRPKTEKTSRKPEIGINDMPNEMLLNIFAYLDQKDILSATLVKKKWNNLISNTENTMKKIQTIYIDPDNMISGIPKFTRPYARIEVENLKLECDLDLLNRLRKIGDGIEFVLFSHCWLLGNAMTSFLRCFKNVEDLHITHCEITSVPVQRKIILRELKLLHIDVGTWPLSFLETPKLITFQCHSVIAEDQMRINKFLNKQTKLEVLDLNCIFNLFHSSSDPLDPKFKLKTLKLTDLVNYENDQMMNLLSSVTESLTSIEIGFEMGRDTTKYALQNFINLESMTIDCDTLPNSPNFYNDIKTSQTLKRVQISGELEKTMPIVLFLDHHPQIEYLDICSLFNIPSTRHSFWSRFAGITKNVASLKIDTIDADNIFHIKSKNLKDLKIYLLEFIDNLNWIEFCSNNPNIERLHVYDKNESFNINDVEVVLKEHLPKLKHFYFDISPTSLEHSINMP